MRILLLSQKGGTGKSTVALLLASILQKAGYDVALDDRDPQGTATFFAENVFGLPSLKESRTAEYIITDTAGHVYVERAIERDLVSVIKDSDKVLLVTEKSPASVHASMVMADLITKHQRKDAKAYVLFNRVRVATSIGQQKAKAIAKDFGIPALKHELPLASAFENAYVHGLGAVTGEHRVLLLNLALEILK